MEFITDYNLTGLLLGLCSFLIIGLFHPLVVKGEYYLGVRCWWGFLLLGIAACVCSVLADGFFVQTLLGVLAFSSFWSILEVFEQRERVRKGWFPANPGGRLRKTGAGPRAAAAKPATTEAARRRTDLREWCFFANFAENKDYQMNLIPEPALRRLPWYLAYVRLLRERNVEYVSSTQISRDLNVDASQIAKDLSLLDIRGKTRIGYEVALLEHTLEEFLGFRKRHRAVVVGAGSLGKALIQDSGLVDYGMEIVAAFDVNPRLIDTERYGIRIYDVAKLRQVCHEVGAGIGIVTVPVEYAQSSADALIEAGVKAIWNFTPYRISVPENVVVTNTSIYAHLAVMYNRMG